MCVFKHQSKDPESPFPVPFLQGAPCLVSCFFCSQQCIVFGQVERCVLRRQLDESSALQAEVGGGSGHSLR